MSLPVPRLGSPRGARFNAPIFFPRPFVEPDVWISTLVSWLNACYYLCQDFSSAARPLFVSFFIFPKDCLQANWILYSARNISAIAVLRAILFFCFVQCFVQLIFIFFLLSNNVDIYAFNVWLRLIVSKLMIYKAAKLIWIDYVM